MYTHTHTHTHTYIYIYINLVIVLSPKIHEDGPALFLKFWGLSQHCKHDSNI